MKGEADIVKGAVGKFKIERCTPCPAGIAAPRRRDSPPRRKDAEIGRSTACLRFSALVDFERCPAGVGQLHTCEAGQGDCPIFSNPKNNPMQRKSMRDPPVRAGLDWPVQRPVPGGGYTMSKI